MPSFLEPINPRLGIGLPDHNTAISPNTAVRTLDISIDLISPLSQTVLEFPCLQFCIKKSLRICKIISLVKIDS
jgi:hypothetical protein